MEAHWQKIRKIHFDPLTGAPFWLKVAKEKNINVFEEIKTLEDFGKLGILDLQTLRSVSPLDFLPKSTKENILIPVESGGTGGEPILTFFSEKEFYQAFVAPFLSIVEPNISSFKGEWLYLGPTGPHAIGRAARLCATILTKREPYTIDFDPRWAKKLPADSPASQRYLNHLCEQILFLVNKISFSCLFVTPPVLNALCDILPKKIKEKTTGIQLGGMDVSIEERLNWYSHFPHAKFIIGYGNSLVGVSYFDENQKGYLVNTNKRYRISIVDVHNNQARLLGNDCPGQIMVHRLDSTILYLNLCERDQAIVKENSGKEILQQVQPLESTKNTIKKGLY